MRVPIRIAALATAALLIAAAVAFLGDSRTSADSETSAFIGLVNMYRAQNGVPPLQSNSGMNAAAQFLAEDNAGRNLLSLVDSLGRNTSERLAAYGVSTSSRFETTPYGYAQGAGLFYSYMESPNHPVTQALCQPKYNAIGVGRTFQDPGNPNGASYGWVWTVTLAKLSGSQTDNEPVQCDPLIVPTSSPPPTPTPVPTATPVGTPTATPAVTATPAPTGGSPAPTATDPPPPTIEPTATPATTATPAPSPTPTSAPKLAGDTDCDLTVGSLDALQVLRETAAMPDIPACIDTGDIDCDGDRDSVDALGILRFTASLPVNQPPTCPPIGWPV